MTPEFPLPARFFGGPVVAGIYIPRAGIYAPLWAVVAESTRPGEFHVGLLHSDQDGFDGFDGLYDIPGWDSALDWMREKADIWRKARR
ncbi:hypothetical protein [Pseudofrankia asymbiotica]|uniref:Uncharacterized protein n=1 Tax=Pseudofrankia asymbiotica TaxID=1834516 RepID=A0A1V2I3R1_9ACTN|nr:hypothetical protein [Pseudofrankia asymbiotica]ONH25194.1 hypothetical protein BL253_27885 [Pseudofrankia asymbiotica]